MFDKRRMPTQARDYKERFEFKLTVDDNIICQRYFKIKDFNKASLSSEDLMDSISRCVDVIDRDLKSKTLEYLEYFAPHYFNSVEEMETYFSNEENQKRVREGHGIVVKGSPVDYFWGKNGKPEELTFKFDNSELVNPIKDDDRVVYKFAFLVDGREVASKIWEGVYPRFVRYSIDISNSKGRIPEKAVSYINSFEEYLGYIISKNRPDLVFGLINDIVTTCSYPERSDYATTMTYGDKTYKNYQTYDDLCKIYGLSEDGMSKLKNKSKKK